MSHFFHQAKTPFSLLRHLLLCALLYCCGMASAQISPTATLVLTDQKGIVSLTPLLQTYLDASGKLDIEQVADSPDIVFKPLNPAQKQQIGNGALWLRFDVQSAGSAPHWRVVLPLATVDQATLYHRLASGQWVSQRGGDGVAQSQSALMGRYPVFALAEVSGQSVPYYLKIQHTRVPYSVWPHIVSEAEFIATSQTQHSLLGVYFGLVGLMVLLAVVCAVVYRDWGFGSYAVYAAMVTASLSAVTGMTALYVFPETPQWNNSNAMLVHCFAAGAGQWFVRTVMSPRRFSRWLDGAMLLLSVGMPVIGIVNALNLNDINFAIYNIALLLCLLATLVTVGIAMFEGDRNARWLALGFLPIVVTTLSPLLRNFGVSATDFSSEYGRMLGSLVELPILFYGLFRRVTLRRQPGARATGLRSTDPLTGVHSAAMLLSKLKQVLNTTERYRQPFALMLIHVTNLAALQKKHSRETADRALVMAAARIRHVAGATDTVARVGDTEFALLMEGPVSLDTANDVATKLLAAGLRATIELPEGEPLKFNITVGHHSVSKGSQPAPAEATLKLLLLALKEMNDGSGKAIRVMKI
jgi:two-component system, sensor histidine kinase LadS